MVLELQPVILAGGEGSKLFPLTDTIPKCLLPVGNKPMIWYPVQFLEKYGFQDFMVIVRKASAEKIHEALRTHCQESSKFQMICIDDDEDIGTAEAMVLIKDKTKTDLLVVSSDMVTDLALHSLVDTYRTYDATLCAVMAKRVDVHPQVEQTKSNKKSKITDPNVGTRDIVSIDPKENRLLFLSNEADLEQETISFTKSLLKKYPKMKIQSSLVDAHLYIIKNWLLSYLAQKPKYESLKSDFIPHVIHKQFSKPKVQSQQIQDSILEEENEGGEKTDKSAKDVFSFATADELVTMTKEWSGYQGNCLKDPIKCYAYVSDDFCLRVNTLPAYTYINRQIVKMKDTLAPNTSYIRLPPSVVQGGKTQIGNDCIIGDSASFGTNVTIKKSMVGKSCIIGSNVRITNSIIMNHVTIADGSTIQGCVICNHCQIGDNCSLTNCQVSGDQKVQENSELKGQTITAQEMEFDDSDDDQLDMMS